MKLFCPCWSIFPKSWAVRPLSVSLLSRISFFWYREKSSCILLTPAGVKEPFDGLTVPASSFSRRVRESRSVLTAARREASLSAFTVFHIFSIVWREVLF